MTDERKRSSPGLWATIIVLVVLVYPISFGPAHWISTRLHTGKSAVERLYQPFMMLWWRGREPRPTDLLVRYANLGCPPYVQCEFGLADSRYIHFVTSQRPVGL